MRTGKQREKTTGEQEQTRCEDSSCVNIHMPIAFCPSHFRSVFLSSFLSRHPCLMPVEVALFPVLCRSADAAGSLRACESKRPVSQMSGNRNGKILERRIHAAHFPRASQVQCEVKTKREKNNERERESKRATETKHNEKLSKLQHHTQKNS